MRCRRLLVGILLTLLRAAPAVQAQLAPEIGYVYPPGGQAGTTLDVRLGGYDWTPDVQLFVHDPRIKLEITGPPTEVLVPDPPYWFGAKGRGPAWPLPREFPARLTIPADVAPGPVFWQVANANGASPPAVFHVGNGPEVVEDESRTGPQSLPQLPVTVSGRIRKIEEIDQYEFELRQSGPVTIRLAARQLGSPLHAGLQVFDPKKTRVVDVADTEGRDLTVTFPAQAHVRYLLQVHDLDYAGDRSYVYRLHVSPGPHVIAAYPAGGRRGETGRIEFVGVGLATGGAALESLTREVLFPAGADVVPFLHTLETPFGPALPHALLVTDTPEFVEDSSHTPMHLSQVPCGVTGTIETRFGVDRYEARFSKDDRWRIAAESRTAGPPLDLELAVIGPDGKELASNDDAFAGTTDPALSLTAPADGACQIVVRERSGRSGSRAACYRLAIDREREDFSLAIPKQLNVPLAGTIKLSVQASRNGGFRGPIQLALSGLPEGVTAPADLTIPADKDDLAIDLTCAADAPSGAALCPVTVSATLNGAPVSRRHGTVLLATTMKPRCKITPEGLDDVRKVHRGSTFPAPVLIERLEGFDGDIVLEMTSKQQRHRQGLASGELTVPPGVTRVEYPIFVPEWMETTKTSRMILNGVAKVADPKGNIRTLVNRMEMRIGILPEGALMKLAHAAGEPTVHPGGELRIPLTVSRAADFRVPVRIELVPGGTQTSLFAADPLTLAPDQTDGTLIVQLADDLRLCGDQPLVLRALALQNGRWPVMSETTVVVSVR